MSKTVIGLARLTMAFCLVIAPAMAGAVDWDGVKSQDVTLFYPGQASWEWVLIPSTHGGAKKFREGTSCSGCHEGEEREMGNLIVSGEKLEPAPPAGMAGAVDAKIAFVQDAQNLYVRLSWPASETDATVTMMIGDNSIREAERAGCWGACHSDLDGMADSQGLKKYLSASRTKLSRTGGGENYKSDAEIADLMAKGQFLEMWQARLTPGEPASARDGYVLKDHDYNASPAVSAEATYRNGEWHVVLARPLVGGGATRHDLESGMTYPVAFAIHEGMTGRHHYVSLDFSLALGQGDADFVAITR
ncbi:MAG: ethylbenzene dehydrogenase-related protein [Pseudomonadota bacterium]